MQAGGEGGREASVAEVVQREMQGEGEPEAAKQKGWLLRKERLEKARGWGRHGPRQWRWLIAICGRRCVRCSARYADGYECQKDHIVPISYGGRLASDALSNLQPLCRRCNLSKGLKIRDYRSLHVLRMIQRWHDPPVQRWCGNPLLGTAQYRAYGG